jgi:hypothetical protein
MAFSFLMSGGPKIKQMRMAVTAAYTDLNVIYLNTLKAKKYLYSGYTK